MAELPHTSLAQIALSFLAMNFLAMNLKRALALLFFSVLLLRLADGMPLANSDPKLDTYGVQRLW